MDQQAAATTAAVSEQQAVHFQFQPVDHVWQQHQAQLFGVDVIKKHIPRKLKKTFTQTTQPTTCVNVRGDGNCFYRVLSLAVSGTEVNHDIMRQQLIAFMMTDRINLQLAQLYPDFDIESAAAVGEWANDAELYAAAAYLETDVLVYTAVGWQIFEAQTLGHKTFACNVYIRHSSNHFYFVKAI